MNNYLIACLATLLVVGQLTACDSGANGQIEKCVQSVVAASGPFKNNSEKIDAEANARLICLRAASGKD